MQLIPAAGWRPWLDFGPIKYQVMAIVLFQSSHSRFLDWCLQLPPCYNYDQVHLGSRLRGNVCSRHNLIVLLAWYIFSHLVKQINDLCFRLRHGQGSLCITSKLCRLMLQEYWLAVPTWSVHDAFVWKAATSTWKVIQNSWQQYVLKRFREICKVMSVCAFCCRFWTCRSLAFDFWVHKFKWKL